MIHDHVIDNTARLRYRNREWKQVPNLTENLQELSQPSSMLDSHIVSYLQLVIKISYTAK